jgi:hypothetical protein
MHHCYETMFWVLSSEARQKCMPIVKIFGTRELCGSYCILSFRSHHGQAVKKKRSGADALVMPHFSTVLECERDHRKDELLEVLNRKLMNNGNVYGDVRWRNSGKDGRVSLSTS